MRITRHYTQRLAAPADVVFPLICPVREAEWLPGFTYRMVYSKSGFAEPGCVFTTQKPDEPETVWCMTKHEREAGHVEFYRVTPGLVVTHIGVTLADAKDNTSSAEITYTFTALSPKGSDLIASQHDESGFLRMAQTWEDCLNRFLRGGGQSSAAN